MLCGGSIGLQADTVTLVSERSIALQGNTVPQVRGNAPQIPCFTMPLEFPAPPSLQPLQGASALASADRFAGGQHAARIPCFTLAIARYRCGLRLVWHENPSLLFVPPRMKHYTSDGCETDLEGMNAGRCDQLYAVVDNDALTIDQADRHAGTAQDIQIVRQST